MALFTAILSAVAAFLKFLNGYMSEKHDSIQREAGAQEQQRKQNGADLDAITKANNAATVAADNYTTNKVQPGYTDPDQRD